MKLKDLNPELINLNTEELIQKLNYTYVFSMIDQISEYYNDNLPLWKVLNYYGIPEPNEGVEQCQVPCLLIEHGSGDRHSSARYFSFDRETGTHREQIYCYKCSKILTSFWYLYKYQKDFHEFNLKDILIFINKTFGVPFPKDLVLDFDPDKYFTFDSEDDKASILEKFQMADKIREHKSVDSQHYLDSILNLYISLNN